MSASQLSKTPAAFASQLMTYCTFSVLAANVKRYLNQVTFGLNRPGSHTELGVPILPAVQAASCSYRFRISCTSFVGPVNHMLFRTGLQSMQSAMLGLPDTRLSMSRPLDIV